MTLYLKYRPQKISELDLVSVRETLTNILSKDSLPHAFLFAGPRGTGKTSAARILAKAINCENKSKGSFEPCGECKTCVAITKGNNIDVIEMDAASSRGIDEIRALKQDIMLAPSISSKKVYIIDEVHMLTTEAANALLKTLEEPPSHVVFILATTDPQKLPATVISRLAVVSFHKASTKELVSKLNIIAKEEKLELEDGVMEVIAGVSDGSFRDAVKCLEELTVSGTKLTKEMANARFSVGAEHSKETLLKLTKEGSASALEFIKKLSENGVDGKAFLNSFISEVHEELLKSAGLIEGEGKISQKDAISLLELLLEAKSRLQFSPSDFLPVEIALLKFKDTSPKDHEKKEQNLPKVESKPEVIAAVVKEVAETKKDTPEEESIEDESSSEPAAPLEPMDLSDGSWATVLTKVREKNGGVEALLRAAKPVAFDGINFKLGFYFKFHKERLEVPSNRVILEEALSGVFGNKVLVSYCLEEPPAQSVVRQSLSPNAPDLTTPKEPDIINAAKEIFGN